MPILDKEPALYPNTLLSDGSDQPLGGTCVGLDNSYYPDPEKRVWWCVYTRSRQEKALARMLYAYEVPFYLPLVPQEHIYRKKRVKSYLPLFSGYMFMFGNDDERISALSTNCISRMLPVDDPEQLVEDLLNIHRLIEFEATMTVEQRLQPGRRVQVTNGSLAGTEGVVVDRRGERRLIVEVRMLNQGASVEIEDFMVEPY